MLFAAVLAVAVVAAEPVKAPPAAAAPATPIAAPAVASTVHVVLFHLKKDAPADAVQEIIAGCHALESIPSVRGLKVGRPASEENSTPKVSSRDYDLALVVLFDDAAGLKTYLDHETHLNFVKTNGKYFDTVQVFDFSDQKK